MQEYDEDLFREWMESRKAAGLPWPCDECESRYCARQCPTFKIRDREDEYNA